MDEWLSKLRATKIEESSTQPPQGEVVFRGNPQIVYTLARDYAPCCPLLAMATPKDCSWGLINIL